MIRAFLKILFFAKKIIKKEVIKSRDSVLLKTNDLVLLVKGHKAFGLSQNIIYSYTEKNVSYSSQKKKKKLIILSPLIVFNIFSCISRT